jgi:hypothetical protein
VWGYVMAGAGELKVSSDATAITLKLLVLCTFSLISTIVAAGSESPKAKAQAFPALSQNPSGPYSQSVGRREMISWVVLSKSYVDLKVDSLREKLNEVYPGQFLPPRDKNFVIDGFTPGQFLIKSNITGAAGMFMLISVPASYTQFSDFAEVIADPALLSSVKAQCCWLSVDLIHRFTTDEDAYRFIEQVLAKLAPPDAAFLVHPEKRITIPFDHDIRRRLANGAQILSSP